MQQALLALMAVKADSSYSLKTKTTLVNSFHELQFCHQLPYPRLV